MDTIDKIDKLFNYYILNVFCKKYNISKEVAINEPIHNFRLSCFKMNYFIKYTVLPKIKNIVYMKRFLLSLEIFPMLNFLFVIRYSN